MRRRKVLTGVSGTILYCVIFALFLTALVYYQNVPVYQALPTPEQTTPNNTETPTPTPESTPNPNPYPDPSEPNVTETPPINYDLVYELPINGATGFALLSMGLRESPDVNSNAMANIAPGGAFRIISAQGNWWNVEYSGRTGWVDNTFCMINLPDIIPSIIYSNPNHGGAEFRSSGYHLPGITNQQLYNAISHNNRFGKQQYIMPVLYSTAIKVYNAQRAALSNGDSLRIYETFRPLSVQRNVSNSLRTLMDTNATVSSGINVGGWNIGWFISQSVSTHQMGAAIDASLVRVVEYETRTTGGHSYRVITRYTNHTMPTRIHELSARAVVLVRGANWNQGAGWENVAFAPTMTDGARRLHNLFVNAGFVPLASEWWHFDDIEGRDTIRGHGITGNFYLRNCVSAEPNINI